MKTVSPAVTWLFTIELISTIAASFSFDAVSRFHRAVTPAAKLTRTICNAKLQKIASNYDLEAIFSIEKELTAEEAETTSFEKMGRKRSSNNDQKKKMMKQQMKQQKQAMQQFKKNQRTQTSSVPNDDSHIIDGYDDGSIDADPGVDYVSLMQEIKFSAYDVPLDLVGRRIDAVLVELLNKEKYDNNNQASNPPSISRSQCGTLLSSGFVFVVSPEDANEFTKTWRADEETVSVPPETIEQFCTPIQRKSYILEPSSILIYPSRDSLLSTSSSSTLLSNFITPTEIIAQKISLDILYEDEHMVVINKQAGMVV
jgi:23S rRNA-/tRNA-specific pseudouridylate synthase